MKLNRFVFNVFNILVILFLFNVIHGKKKERISDRYYESSDSREETDEEGGDEEESGYSRPRPPPQPQHGGRGRGPPGGLPPGQAKKQQNRETVVSYEGPYIDQRPPQSESNNHKNKNKKNKPPKNNNKENPRPRPPPVNTEPSDTEVTVPLSEWRQLERLQHHWGNTAHTKSALSRKFIFFLDRDVSYQRHDACLTPDNQLGSCHFVQHCPIPDVIRSFDKFLSYVCFIHNRYVGICCPDDYLDVEDPGGPQEALVPTRRPHKQTARPVVLPTNRPRIPSSDNGSDGSDYINDICGLSENTRIIGGAVADPKDWIWMAALLLTSDTKPYCGGAVITNQHILTAAHCLKDLSPDDIIVRLGAYDFSQSADPEAQDFSVEYFKIHSQYNRHTNENDLAIIKLKEKTAFTDSVKPICLPQRNRNYAGQLAIVTGWGHTSFGGTGSAQLRQVSLPVWNNTACDAAYSVAISDEMLCAGNRNGGQDSCQGDSGGPIMLQGPNKRWMIIGVVSWGIKCGQPNYPGVYTRVSKYIDWIKVNSKDVYKK